MRIGRVAAQVELNDNDEDSVVDAELIASAGELWKRGDDEQHADSDRGQEIGSAEATERPRRR
jgi:hypothetical protein